MNRRLNLKMTMLLGFLLSLAGVLFAQGMPNKQFLVNGKATGIPVLQVNGHSYIDIETLAQITNGRVTFESNQIVLTIPNSPADAPFQQAKEGLSKSFASAAIASLAEMKEWKGVLGAMVTYGLAVGKTWTQDYQDRVQTSLAQATVAASTNSDQVALQLLNNQFTNLAKWAGDIVGERQALNGARTMTANALQNDPALTKISNCGTFLIAMLGSGIVADNPNCH